MMTTISAPTIWMYGGVHNDPGSCRGSLSNLPSMRQHRIFVAVEWEQSLFERLAAWRAAIAQELGRCWDFPDAQRVRRAFVCACVGGETPLRSASRGTDVLWLENGFQEEDLKRRYGAHVPARP